MLHFAAQHGVRPMIERFKMSDLNTALARVREGKVRYRAVLENQGQNGFEIRQWRPARCDFRRRVLRCHALYAGKGHGATLGDEDFRVCEGFGCRPHDGGAAHRGAGVRKPPREETAGGDVGGAAWAMGI